jgi:hypothetical protein
MNILGGIIGPIGVLVLGICYALLTIISLYLVVKSEKSLSLFLWILLILVFPIIGSLIYLARHSILKG